jgi:hypothetical protein
MALTDIHQKRVVFKVSNCVWVVLTRDKFLVGDYNKLMKKEIGPCQVL